MSKRVYVDIGHKQYSVTYDADGRASIWTSWEVIDPSTVHNAPAHQGHFTRSMNIMASGKLGKKVLKLAAAQLAKEAS